MKHYAVNHATIATMQQILQSVNSSMLEPTSALAYTAERRLQKALGDLPLTVKVKRQGNRMTVHFFDGDGECGLEVFEDA